MSVAAFDELARELKLPEPMRGQKNCDRLPLWTEELPLECSFEFGDRRWALGDRNLVLEHDTANGACNWIKYLPYLWDVSSARLRLIHVYEKPGPKLAPDTHYLSSRKLQGWVHDRLKQGIRADFDGRVFLWPRDRDAALRQFREWVAWLRQ